MSSQSRGTFERKYLLAYSPPLTQMRPQSTHTNSKKCLSSKGRYSSRNLGKLCATIFSTLLLFQRLTLYLTSPRQDNLQISQYSCFQVVVYSISRSPKAKAETKLVSNYDMQSTLLVRIMTGLWSLPATVRYSQVLRSVKNVSSATTPYLILMLSTCMWELKWIGKTRLLIRSIYSAPSPQESPEQWEGFLCRLDR